MLKQFSEIFELVETIKPRYAILIDSFYKIFNQAKGHDVERMIRNINKIKKSYCKEMKDLTRSAEKIKANKKTILIYDHSHSVQNALRQLQKKRQKFSVLVAEQDLEKTGDNIAFLHKSNIPFKVVPSYMVSHLEDSIDMAFFGAVTFQEGGRFVMDPGSKSIISQLRLEKKPIYLFLTTSKFSLWPVKDVKKQVHVKSDIRNHHHFEEVAFERLKFSHDRVPVDLVDHVVTEKGIFNPEQTKKEFASLMKTRKEERSRLELP